MLATPGGAPLTLSALAAEAQVSRRTLYVHWGTIQQVISDAVTFEQSHETIDTAGMTQAELLRSLLVGIRTAIHDHASNVALSTMVAQAAQSPEAAEVLRSTGAAGVARLSELLAPVSPEQYAQIVGPLAYAEFVDRAPASDALIDELVERGLEILGISASVASSVDVVLSA
jgi:AcrR family transcriptional regulator